MTSSLVGSEMCIRDSYISGRPGGKRCPAGEPVHRQPPCRNDAEQSQRLCCLLYTSDAADDM
eukprot:5733460-Prorocentrum_lima.AAC.1